MIDQFLATYDSIVEPVAD